MATQPQPQMPHLEHPHIKTWKSWDNCPDFFGSLSTVVGDEKLTSREDRIGPLFMYAQCDEDTFLKVDEVSKTEP